MREYKVGVVGLGFVGGSLQKSFESRGQEVIGYDKYKEIGTFESLYEAPIIFLCLPTPFVEGHGYDISALHEVCRKLGKATWDGIVVIKSTVEPGTCATLGRMYDLAILHNPEFLTARTAFEDFDGQTHIILGTSFWSQPGTEIVEDLYKRLYPNAKISKCTREEAESMKLFCNNFYAVKVQMFNEFYLLCQRTGADFNKVKELMVENGWINEMHTTVPGPDGSLSYGGACFPKDTNALCQFMERAGTPHEVLEACISERNKMRKD